MLSISTPHAAGPLNVSCFTSLAPNISLELPPCEAPRKAFASQSKARFGLPIWVSSSIEAIDRLPSLFPVFPVDASSTL